MERSRGGALDIWVLICTQFGISMSFNFVVVFLPFYIASVSRADRETTLLWVGIIMSVSPTMAAIGAPIWGGLTARISPKRLMEYGLLSSTFWVGLVGFVSSLPLVFLIRLVHGVLGGISTISMIILAALVRPVELPRYLGLFHSSITLGQIVGPPLGAFAAAALGYPAAFLVSSALLFACFLTTSRFLGPVPPQPREAGSRGVFRLSAYAAWGLAMMSTVQIGFLPSVLPELLQGLAVRGDRALLSAGGVVMASGLAASLGAVALSRLTLWVSTDRLILATAVGSAVGLLGMGWSENVWTFTAFRMVETGCIAGTVPLVFSLFAGKGQGRTIGALNSARFAGNALGPILATAILARSTPPVLYSAIAGLTVVALSLFAVVRGRERLSTFDSL
ncbi:MAG: MFS transporter [Candidatus Rokubacteria bacterium]|nr:MFS transporter [Candidatus Rokubacteria bacterium]